MKNDKLKIAEKWYKVLGFPESFDDELYSALETKDIITETIEEYDLECEDGVSNLLHMLYFCERTSKAYEEKGISHEILIDTLKDIVRWTITWSDVKGSLWLKELGWLSHHLKLKLFKLGRLQFCFESAHMDYPIAGVKKGDNIVGIHIPSVGPLDIEECKKSIDLAREFMGNFVPEYEYKIFNCHSWLLDKKLETVLKSDSNILKFRTLFEMISDEKSDAILKYIFTWDTTRDNLPERECTSSFSKAVNGKVLSGEYFNESVGIIRK